MNQTLFKSLTPAIIGTVTIATVANIKPANAAQLAPGRINLLPQQGIEFLNNAIDFNPNNTDFVPLDISQGGDYIVNFATDAFEDFGFLNTTVRAVDIYTPSSSIPSVNGNPAGSFADDVNYDLVNILAGSGQLVNVDGMQGVPFLYYDLTDNGNFTDGDDAIFYATGFTRSATEEADGSFDTSVNFQGFIDTVDSDDSPFEKTTVDLTLFNGATSVDPNTIPPIDGPPPTNLGDSGFTPDFTNLDAVQETSTTAVPEASNILAIFSLTILILSMKLKKSKTA